MKLTRRLVGALIAFGVWSLTHGAWAQAPDSGAAFPNRMLRLIVPYPPGGTTDIVGRVVAKQLSEVWGQQVIVENRGGGATVIGTEALARAPADGYTLMLATPEFTVNPSLRSNLPYDPVRDFAPVGLIANYPLVLVVHPSVGAASASEFIALAKARPTQLIYGSGGNGGTPHLSMELLKTKAGIDLTHVPYKGNGPAITDLLAGRVHAMFTGMPPVAGYLKAGRLKLLASSGLKRMVSAPDIPTVAEQGVPDFEVLTWFGLLVPAGTPNSIVNTINQTLQRVMVIPETQEKLASLGADLVVSSPAEFKRIIDSEIRIWGEVVRTSNVRAE